MLAMVVNDYTGCLMPRGALGFFASMLAPTVSSSQVLVRDVECEVPTG